MAQYVTLKLNASNAYRFPKEAHLVGTDAHYMIGGKMRGNLKFGVIKEELFGIPMHAITNLMAVLCGDYPVPFIKRDEFPESSRYDMSKYEDMASRAHIVMRSSDPEYDDPHFADDPHHLDRIVYNPLYNLTTFRGRKKGVSEKRDTASIEFDIEDENGKKKKVKYSGEIYLDGNRYLLSRSIPTFYTVKHYAKKAYEVFDNLCKLAFGNDYQTQYKYMKMTDCISMMRDKYLSDTAFQKAADSACEEYSVFAAEHKYKGANAIDMLVRYPVSKGYPYKSNPTKEGAKVENVLWRNFANYEMTQMERATHKITERVMFYKTAHVTYAEIYVKVTPEEYRQIEKYGGFNGTLFDEGIVNVDWKHSGSQWNSYYERFPLPMPNPTVTETTKQKYGDQF